jgi:hypothetical protein
MNFVLFFVVAATTCWRSLAYLTFPSSPSFSSISPSLHGVQLPSPSLLSRSTSIRRTKEINIQSSQPEEVDVLIVGGGLCGSTAAFYLNQSGVKNILLVEAKESLGGCIHSRRGSLLPLSTTSHS